MDVFEEDEKACKAALAGHVSQPISRQGQETGKIVRYNELSLYRGSFGSCSV